MAKRKKSYDYPIKRSKLVILELNPDGSLNTILFRNKKWNKFVTLGGRVDDKDKSFEEALIREVKEESLNVFDISQIIYNTDKMKYIDFCSNKEKIRVYFLLIKTGLFNQDVYDENRKILANRNLKTPQEWKEMDSYNKFNLKEVLETIGCLDDKDKCFQCQNIKGNSKLLYHPIAKYLKEATKRNLINEMISKQLVVKDCAIDRNTSESFLKGTSTIRVKQTLVNTKI